MSDVRACSHAHRGWVIGGWRCMSCDKFVVLIRGRWVVGWPSRQAEKETDGGWAGPWPDDEQEDTGAEA